jgi:adenylate cyclase, class 2
LSVETEVKVKIENIADFCRRLQSLNPIALSSRHFEDNYVLDFPDQKLQTSHCLLRVRFAEGRNILTFKGSPRPDGIFKSREELETKLENGATMLEVLKRIGMRIYFQYQKYRREFELDGVHVAVDETPVGNYAEFEGSEEGIRNLADKMDITESRFLRSSYFSLYLEYCRTKGETPGLMVF